VARISTRCPNQLCALCVAISVFFPCLDNCPLYIEIKRISVPILRTDFRNLFLHPLAVYEENSYDFHLDRILLCAEWGQRNLLAV
jgi:hypothetical protein